MVVPFHSGRNDDVVFHIASTVEPKRAGTAGCAIEVGVAGPPTADAFGRGERLVDALGGNGNFDQMHNVGHTPI
jgi:hypothetical protein